MNIDRNNFSRKIKTSFWKILFPALSELSNITDHAGRRLIEANNRISIGEIFVMATSKGPTKDQLLDENDRLRAENEALQETVDDYSERLDRINSITADDDDDDLDDDDE